MTTTEMQPTDDDIDFITDGTPIPNEEGIVTIPEEVRFEGAPAPELVIGGIPPKGVGRTPGTVSPIMEKLREALLANPDEWINFFDPCPTGIDMDRHKRRWNSRRTNLSSWIKAADRRLRTRFVVKLASEGYECDGIDIWIMNESREDDEAMGDSEQAPEA